MLFEPILQIVALLVLPSEAVKSGGTEVAKEIVQNGYNIKFGRSIPSFTAQDELEHSLDTSANAKTSKPDDFLRSLRGKDGFIRFGRGKNDNFLRFGRGKQDNFMRFGRSNAIEKKPDGETDEYDRLTRSGKGNKKSEKFERLTKNFIRLGRGKQDNFMRFGRGKQDNFMRFGRGKQDNFMRFGRGKQDNFMRFGRGKQDNFMRFGRGKQDNFMRFGRGKQDNFMRFGRGKEDNYMRFGRDVENFYLPFRKENLDLNDLLGNIEESPGNIGWHIKGDSDDNIPIAMRSSPVDDNYLDRFVSSARPDNDLRFGKSDSNQQSSKVSKFSENLKTNPTFYTDSTIPLRDTFSRDLKSKINDGINLLRQGRHPPNKDDSFIRFGRDSLGSTSTIVIPQRRKRSAFELDESLEDILSSKIHGGDSHHILLPVFALTDYRDEDISSSEQPEGYNSRKKRSLNFKLPSPTPIADIPEIYSLKDVTSNLLVESGNIPHTFVSPLFLFPKTS